MALEGIGRELVGGGGLSKNLGSPAAAAATYRAEADVDL